MASQGVQPGAKSPDSPQRVIPTPRTNPKRNPQPKPPATATAPAPATVRRSIKPTPSNGTSTAEPLKKKQKLKYIPGGPGGGGRYVDEVTGEEIPVGGTGPGGYNYIGPRGRVGRENLEKGVVPIVYPSRRDRSQRTRPTLPRTHQSPTRFNSSSAAQMAAAQQNDGYKPREERALEEFHPKLDINAPLFAFSANDLAGILPESRPVTPAHGPQSANGSTNGVHTGDDAEGGKAASEGGRSTPSGSINGSELAVTIKIPGTPGGGKRGPGRPPKDPVAFYTSKAMKQHPGIALQIATPNPKTPKVTPVQNINPKEKLTLPQPSYRESDTLAKFEDKSSQRYVDQSMSNVGYQITDVFIRPENELIKASDIKFDDDLTDRVEYDMDSQDCNWLISYNKIRKDAGVEEITKEVFEITITKIEKEWHALEKRIPKPNPKPPQTHRPRSSSAAAVNGEPLADEEQDSKCAICDDGDCENTNAIVFCDGCELAVHQECYGVPFIPEGQWHCRKCSQVSQGIPTCIFCPNMDGAFKHTVDQKWAHSLCAIWIPEVSLGNTTFMEPIMEVEKVPNSRWKLTCYICNQKMGACIQCGNKACYQAFHVTCARKARLFLKMKNSHGVLSILDGNTPLKAFCDKHCPADHAEENDVANAILEAQQYYKKAMKYVIWADNQDEALALAAEYRQAETDHQPGQSQLMGQNLADGNKNGSQPHNTGKLPSGAPLIPKVVYDVIESSLQRFGIRKRKEWTADACRYWSLKREARRGAPLLKRLQMQDNFTSSGITRRNYAAMGQTGKVRLQRRAEFAGKLVVSTENLLKIALETVEREKQKLEAEILRVDIMDTTLFPVAKLLPPIIKEAKRLDEKKTVFTDGLVKLEAKLGGRVFVSALTFAHALSKVFSSGIAAPASTSVDIGGKDDEFSPSKKPKVDLKDRKRHAKRIIRAVTPGLQAAVRAEAEVANLPAENLLKELEGVLEAAQSPLEPVPGSWGEGDSGADIEQQANGDAMVIDSPTKASPSKRSGTRRTNGMRPEEPDEQATGNESAVVDDLLDIDAPGEVDDTDPNTAILIAAEAPPLTEVNGNVHLTKKPHTNGVKDTTSTPPDTNGYVSASEMQQPDPPTPPVSNGGIGTEPTETLTKGGLPWYMKDFHPEGTSAQEKQWTGRDVALSEELSDMDDEQLRGLGADVDVEDSGESGETAMAGGSGTGNSVARTKKAKTKKRYRGYK